MKTSINVLLICASLFAAEQFMANEIISSEMWTEGFSADVKVTSNFPGAASEEIYKIYCDDEGNVRTESGNSIMLFLNEDDAEKVYVFNKLTKTGKVMTSDETGAPEKPPRPSEEDNFVPAGNAGFAGAQCDKYQADTRGTSIQGQLFYFIDPTEKIFMGYENRNGDLFKRAEYTGIEFESDPEMFKPLDGFIIK